MIQKFKLFENIAQSKSLLKRLNIGLDNPDYLEIRKLLSGKDGYVNWFCELFFIQKVNINELRQIVNIIDSEKAIIRKFTK